MYLFSDGADIDSKLPVDKVFCSFTIFVGDTNDFVAVTYFMTDGGNIASKLLVDSVSVFLLSTDIVIGFFLICDENLLSIFFYIAFYFNKIRFS